MVIGLRNRIAVSGALDTGGVRANHRPVGRLTVTRQPGHQGGSEIKTEPLIVVGDPDQRPIHRLGTRIGPVTFAEDAFIPVGERGGTGFWRHQSGPWTLPWRLVEMTVNYNVTLVLSCHLSRFESPPAR